jgi:hypothetical protein
VQIAEVLVERYLQKKPAAAKRKAS